MIEVVILEDHRNLGTIRITEMGENFDGTADYSVQFGVDRGGDSLGLHQRSIFAFPKRNFNTLALLRQALATLEEEELRRDHAETSSPNLARRLLRKVRDFSKEE